MIRRKPMQAKAKPPRPAREWEGPAPVLTPPRATLRSDGKARMVVMPKTEPLRDRDYLRWVASLPCIACGIEGRSQAAHGPTLGRGIKASDDTCVPLCADSPGVVGCHSLVDRYEAFGRAERVRKMEQWAAETRALWAQKGKA